MRGGSLCPRHRCRHRDPDNLVAEDDQQQERACPFNNDNGWLITGRSCDIVGNALNESGTCGAETLRIRLDSTKVFRGHPSTGYVQALCFTSSYDGLAAVTQRSVTVFETQNWSQVFSWDIQTEQEFGGNANNYVSSAEFTKDSSRLLIVFARSVMLCDSNTGHVIERYSDRKLSTMTAKLLPDDSKFVMAQGGGMAHIGDCSDARAVVGWRIHGKEAEISGVATTHSILM
jgi:hypothetical protein